MLLISTDALKTDMGFQNFLEKLMEYLKKMDDNQLYLLWQ